MYEFDLYQISYHSKKERKFLIWIKSQKQCIFGILILMGIGSKCMPDRGLYGFWSLWRFWVSPRKREGGPMPLSISDPLSLFNHTSSSILYRKLLIGILMKLCPGFRIYCESVSCSGKVSNLFGNLLIKEMAIVVLCSGYTQNRHPPPPIQSISSAFTDEDRKGQISPIIHYQIGDIRL